MKKVIFYFLTLIFLSGISHADEHITSSSTASLVLLSGGGTNAGGATVQADEFSGSANYSIPIPVPPARGGVTPTLSLSYNSLRRNVNSWVGYGWEFELGSIARSAGFNGIDYDNGTDFEVRLSGQSESLQRISQGLDPTTYGITDASGYVADLYQAKIESGFGYYLFLYSASDPHNQKGWVVLDKSGVRYFFGSQANARDVAATSTGIATLQVYSWKLDKIIDANNNTLVVNYGANHLLSQIIYPESQITIDFEVGAVNSDAGSQAYFPMFREAFQTRERLGHVLKSITINHAGSRLQKVAFNYTVSTIRRVRYLTSLQQFGSSDSEFLPETRFEYFGEDEISFSDTSFSLQASHDVGGRFEPGWTNDEVTFADMNGDGLVDQVVANPDGSFQVYFNNGNDFVEIPGRSRWEEPFSHASSRYDDDPWEGRLTASRRGHQWLFLADINGDGLPDRFGRILVGGWRSSEETAAFRIAFNNGHGWDAPVEWADPFVGGWAGTSDIDKGFYDMNGDGLLDRVVGDRAPDSHSIDILGAADHGRFLVYYNTGSGFRTTPEYWTDPLTRYSPDHENRAQLYAADGENTFLTIRDVNGDGLPDRVFRGNFFRGDTSVGTGFTVFMNNGKAWSLSEPLPDHPGRIRIDGFGTLGIVDNVQDEGSRGFLNKRHDLIDVNGDGFLDRVEGVDATDGNCNFRFSIYHGTTNADTFSQLSDPLVVHDPIRDDSVYTQTFTNPRTGVTTSRPLPQWHACGDIYNENDGKYYSFFQDFNGDGLPDRMALHSRYDGMADHLENHYVFHPMHFNAVTFHDSPRWWHNQYINQPIGNLKGILDGQGTSMAVEYNPSSWPQVEGRPNNWFLPFNMNLVHKIYTQDYTIHSEARSLTYPEVLRHPGMRWTTHYFRGGNYFVLEPNVGRSNVYVKFNGFQEATKLSEPLPGDTWTTTKTITFYHQAKGDVHPLVASDESFFDIYGFGHFALSGKSYKQIVYESSHQKVTQETEYKINPRRLFDNFNCGADSETMVTRCYPRLHRTTKNVFEDGASRSRSSRVVFRHDDLGNLLEESSYDSNNNLYLKVETSYYPEFSVLKIRDRVLEINKKDAADNLLRRKHYEYDSKGNPSKETYYLNRDGSQFLTNENTFSSIGVMSTTQDVDAVHKSITYDSHSIFPVQENITTPSGSVLSLSRRFNPLNGEPLQETSPQNVGKWTRQDSFGRKIEEGVQDTTGSSSSLGRFQYDYVRVNVDGWENTLLLKSQSWSPQEGYDITDRLPSEVAYSDVSGNVLQKCILSERGNYRLVQSRKLEAGSYEVQTEPSFSENCDFITSIPTTARLKKTYKDFFERPSRIENPAGDTDSPIDNVSIDYSTNSLGLTEKKTTDSRGRSYIEILDTQERIVEVKDPAGTSTYYQYNPIGDLLNVSVGSERRVLTSMEYDLSGRKISMTDANMGTWTYEYNAQSQLEWQTDNAGNKVHTIYDTIGRIIRKEFLRSASILEGKEIYTYDRGESGYNVLPGELFQVEERNSSDALVRKTKFSYDNVFRRNSRMTRVIPGLADFHQDMEYDLRGRVTRVVNPGGNVLRYQYMMNGEMMKLCDSVCDASHETYYSIDPSTAFNQFGNLLKESFGNGVNSEYSYYPLSHRLNEKTISKVSDPYSRRRYQYDVAGNITKLSDPLNQQGTAALDQASYDNLDRLTSYRNQSDRSSFTFGYDAQGNITQNQRSFGSTPYEYTSTRPHAVTRIGTSTFGYDANGNMTRDPNRTMDYNAQNQLVQVTMANGSVVNYEYDYTGTRVKKSSSQRNAAGGLTRQTTHYLGDAIEIENGQLILNIFAGSKKVAVKGLGEVSRLTGAGGGTLIDTNIDPDTNLATLFPYICLILTLIIIGLMRDIPHICPEWIKNPSLRKGYAAWRGFSLTIQESIFQYPIRKYVKSYLVFQIILLVVQYPIHVCADSGEPPAVASDQEYFYYIHDDHLSSSHIMTEGKIEARHSGIMYRRGDILQRIEYAPFGGETFVLNPNLKLNPSYTGQKYDIESGLYYYKARYYNPEIGRFIQADTAIQDKHDLQSYNRYAYVRNNPLKYTDPTGHFFWFAFLFAIILGAALGAVSAAIFGGNILMGALQGMITGAIFFGAGEIIQGMSITSQLVKAGIHAAAGAISGAINSAISGQSLAGIGRSSLIGAISAGVSKYADKYLNDKDFMRRLLGRTLIGAATGATASAIMGGNILQGVWIGGATAAAGTIFNDLVHEGTNAARGLHQRIVIRDSSGKIKYGISFGMDTAADPDASPFTDNFSTSENPTPGGTGNGAVYEDMNDPSTRTIQVFHTTPAEDQRIINYMQNRVGDIAPYNALTNNCRGFSSTEFNRIVRQIESGRP